MKRSVTVRRPDLYIHEERGGAFGTECVPQYDSYEGNVLYDIGMSGALRVQVLEDIKVAGENFSRVDQVVASERIYPQGYWLSLDMTAEES